jgi:hypothetical protein
MTTHRLATMTAIFLTSALLAAAQTTPAPRLSLPRTADGKPNFEACQERVPFRRDDAALLPFLQSREYGHEFVQYIIEIFLLTR